MNEVKAAYNLKEEAIRWEGVAKRLARSIIRFTNDNFATNLPESTLKLAWKVAHPKKTKGNI